MKIKLKPPNIKYKKPDESIFLTVAGKYYPAKTMCEVGVGCNKSFTFRNLNEKFYDKMILVEPNPNFYSELKKTVNRKTVLLQVAVADVKGTYEFYNLGYSSYRKDTVSPASSVGYKEEKRNLFTKKGNVKLPDEFKNFKAEGKLFSEIDDGDIDVLSIDCEGSEWFVIKNMTSRPKLIKIEINSGNSKYVNPYKKEIYTWMKQNNYKIIEEKTDVIWEIN